MADCLVGSGVLLPTGSQLLHAQVKMEPEVSRIKAPALAKHCQGPIDSS